jgi:putative membrane protein
MKKSIYITLLLLASSSSFAVENSNTDNATNANFTTTEAPGAADAKTQKNGEFVAFLITLNKNEVSLADLALNKNMNAQATDYAKMLKKDHTAGLEKTMEVSKETAIQPLDTVMVIAMQQKGQQDKAALNELQGNAFEKAYIDSMVVGHQNALNAIDKDFQGQISNDKLEDLLQKTKTRVTTHLDDAKKIQAELNKGA